MLILTRVCFPSFISLPFVPHTDHTQRRLQILTLHMEWLQRSFIIIHVPATFHCRSSPALPSPAWLRRPSKSYMQRSRLASFLSLSPLFLVRFFDPAWAVSHPLPLKSSRARLHFVPSLLPSFPPFSLPASHPPSLLRHLVCPLSRLDNALLTLCANPPSCPFLTCQSYPGQTESQTSAS